MKEVILLIIAAIFAVIYNIILLMVYEASGKGELESTSEALTILNTLKDFAILSVILFNIFLEHLEGGIR